MADNVASRRVLEKVGFQFAGQLRLAANYCGRQAARLYFDLIRDEVGSAVPTKMHDGGMADLAGRPCRNPNRR